MTDPDDDAFGAFLRNAIPKLGAPDPEAACARVLQGFRAQQAAFPRPGVVLRFRTPSRMAASDGFSREQLDAARAPLRRIVEVAKRATTGPDATACVYVRPNVDKLEVWSDDPDLLTGVDVHTHSFRREASDVHGALWTLEPAPFDQLLSGEFDLCLRLRDQDDISIVWIPDQEGDAPAPL